MEDCSFTEKDRHRLSSVFEPGNIKSQSSFFNDIRTSNYLAVSERQRHHHHHHHSRTSSLPRPYATNNKFFSFNGCLHTESASSLKVVPTGINQSGGRTTSVNGKHKWRSSKKSTTKKDVLTTTRVVERLLKEHYTLGKHIGKGHFSTVHSARHKITGSDVAVKIVSKRNLTDDCLRYIHQEVKFMKRVQHPHVVRLYEVIENSSTINLILELGDGDLYDYLNIFGDHGFSDESVQQVFKQILSGLVHCHEQNVCHRDLKPENLVFFEKFQTVKLADFGFSNHYAPGSKLKTSCGSLAYSAPEVLRGNPYEGMPADVWSLGVILFLLSSGISPFQRGSDSETLCSIFEGQFSFPQWMPFDCQRLISRMLVQNPSLRITLSELANDAWMTSLCPLRRHEQCQHGCCWRQSGQHPGESLLSVSDVPLRIHHLVMDMLISRGFDNQREILSDLQTDGFTNLTAMYFLMAERIMCTMKDSECDALSQFKLLKPRCNVATNSKSSIKDINAAIYPATVMPHNQQIMNCIPEEDEDKSEDDGTPEIIRSECGKERQLVDSNPGMLIPEVCRSTISLTHEQCSVFRIRNYSVPLMKAGCCVCRSQCHQHYCVIDSENLITQDSNQSETKIRQRSCCTGIDRPGPVDVIIMSGTDSGIPLLELSSSGEDLHGNPAKKLGLSSTPRESLVFTTRLNSETISGNKICAALHHHHHHQKEQQEKEEEFEDPLEIRDDEVLQESWDNNNEADQIPLAGDLNSKNKPFAILRRFLRRSCHSICSAGSARQKNVSLPVSSVPVLSFQSDQRKRNAMQTVTTSDSKSSHSSTQDLQRSRLYKSSRMCCKLWH